MRSTLILSILLLFIGFEVSAQNVFRSGDGWANEAGWSSNAFFVPSLGGSQIFTTSNNTMGTDVRARQFFRLGRDFSGFTEFGPFSPCADEAYVFDTEITLANWCGGGAFFIDVPADTYNYVFKTPEISATANRVITFELQGAVATPRDGATTHSIPCEDSVVNVTAVLDKILPVGEASYLRYSTDGFATSTVVPMTCTGTSCTGTIPASVNTIGMSVDYYIFTSGSNVAPDHSTADWYTISFDTNGGGNYSYSVIPTPQVTMTVITPVGYGPFDNQGTNAGSGPICSGDQLITVQSTATPDDGNGNPLWIRSVNNIPANVTTFQLVPGTVHVPYAAAGPPFFLQFGDMFVNTGTQPETVLVVVTPYFETNPALGASLDETAECFGPDITIEVIVNPGPILAPLTPEVCSEEADDVDLIQFEILAGVPAVLPAGASVAWYRGDVSTGMDVTATKASVTLSDGELFTLVYTNANGCSAQSAVTFTVNKVDCGSFPWEGDN